MKRPAHFDWLNVEGALFVERTGYALIQSRRHSLRIGKVV
jgi:hypothetical protein